jgi:hypothetical protein
LQTAYVGATALRFGADDAGCLWFWAQDVEKVFGRRYNDRAGKTAGRVAHLVFDKSSIKCYDTFLTVHAAFDNLSKPPNHLAQHFCKVITDAIFPPGVASVAHILESSLPPLPLSTIIGSSDGEGFNSELESFSVTDLFRRDVEMFGFDKVFVLSAFLFCKHSHS